MNRCFLFLVIVLAAVTALADETREVTGVVVDSDGAPAPFARIWDHRGDVEAQADRRGQFKIKVSRRTHRLWAFSGGCIGAAFASSANDDLHKLTLKLGEAKLQKVRVIDVKGDPVRDARVAVLHHKMLPMPAHVSKATSVLTDHDGYATLYTPFQTIAVAVKESETQVYLNPPSEVMLRKTAEIRGTIEGQLPEGTIYIVAKSRNVNLHVTEHGAHVLAGVQVTSTKGLYSTWTHRTVRVNKDGTFRIGGFPIGGVREFLVQYKDNQRWQIGLLELNQVEPGVNQLKTTTYRAMKITGRVMANDQSVAKSEVRSGNYVPSTQSAADGRFTLYLGNYTDSIFVQPPNDTGLRARKVSLTLDKARSDVELGDVHLDEKPE